MTSEQLNQAQESLARCLATTGFLDTLYQKLMASSPVIPPLFAHTDFERQHKLLQHGLGVLLIYAKRRNPALLERIAVRHSRSDVAVDPSLYPSFVDSLVAAVRLHDPQWKEDVEMAWRAAVAPGIQFMMSRY